MVPTFSLENGTLKGTQMRYDTPAKDGKPEVKGHQAVIGNDIPTKDSVIEFRFKLGGAQSVTAEYDDRKFNGSHYGHICMARIAAGSCQNHGPENGGRQTRPRRTGNPGQAAGRTPPSRSPSIPRPGIRSCWRRWATPCRCARSAGVELPVVASAVTDCAPPSLKQNSMTLSGRMSLTA